MAARLFSTDDTYENVIVRPEHVKGAVQFMDRIYQMQAFGYAERSRQYIGDREEAERNKDNIAQYLKSWPTLAKFLLGGSGKFRRPDLEEVLNISREEANGIINTLWESKMVRKDLGDIRVEPTLHALLREHRW
jgi:hypothetical protein